MTKGETAGTGPRASECNTSGTRAVAHPPGVCTHEPLSQKRDAFQNRDTAGDASAGWRAEYAFLGVETPDAGGDT